MPWDRAAETAIVRWSVVIISSGIGLIVLQLAFELVLRLTGELRGPSPNLSAMPIGLMVLIVGAILLAFAGRNHHKESASRDDAPASQSAAKTRQDRPVKAPTG